MASEVEENATLLAENGTNLTGREAATPAGIAVTYSSLFLMALGPILIGSFRSVTYHAVLKVWCSCYKFSYLTFLLRFRKVEKRQLTE